MNDNGKSQGTGQSIEPSPQTLLSRDEFIGAIDKEIDLAVDSQKQIGLTKWGLLIAIGGLSLMIAKLWETGGVNIAKSLSLFIGISLITDGVLRLLRSGGRYEEVTGSHWYDPPFHLATDPPLAAICHRLFLITALFWSASAASRILPILTILFFAPSLVIVSLHALLSTHSGSRLLSKIPVTNAFTHGVKGGYLIGSIIEPLFGVTLGFWHCWRIGIPQQGTSLANIKFGVLVFLIVSLAAHLIQGSERSRLNALQVLRRQVALRDLSTSDGKLALDTLMKGIISHTLISGCREICVICNNIEELLNRDASSEGALLVPEQFSKLVQSLKGTLNKIRIQLATCHVIEPAASVSLESPFQEAELAIENLLRFFDRKNCSNNRIDKG